MADPFYSGDYFTDLGMGIKLEAGMDALVSSASVPIPHRRMQDADFGYELTCDPFNLSSPLVSNDNTLDASNMSDVTLWGRDSRADTFRMDEEDIFQVDKSDLIQGPTLAELNANENHQALLEDLNFDDFLLPGDNIFSVPSVTMSQMDESSVAPSHETLTSSQTLLSVNTSFAAASFPPAGLGFYKDLGNSSASVPSSPLDAYVQNAPSLNLSPSSQPSSSSSSLPPRSSTLHELLLKREPLGRSVPTASSPLRRLSRPRGTSCLSSSAPTHLGFDQIWQRREPRRHLLSTGSLAEADSTSSISTAGILSPGSYEFSHDEGSDTEEESDHPEYDDATTDGESTDGEADKDRPPRPRSKKERYFWQYNVQSKGPKGQRLVLKTKQDDPHVLNEVTDPVFSPSCSVRGIKHSGKARKGDGNDLTPNPRKLHVIGKELDKLNKVIDDITPVAELPFNVRPKTRKEKNKLASRACRLKKKAQHEANKIKLFGLQQEHQLLLNGIPQMKQLIVAKVTDSASVPDFPELCEKIAKSATKVKIAGRSTEYVNRVLEKMKSGGADGALNEF